MWCPGRVTPEGDQSEQPWGKANKVKPVVREDRVEQPDPVLKQFRAATPLASIQKSKIVMVLVIACGTMGLSRFATSVTQLRHNIANGDQPGGGIIVRSEVLQIWLPETLVGLAKLQSRSGVLQTHEDLAGYLEDRGERDLWYALTVRSYLVDGGLDDTTFIRHPFREPERFSELLGILAVAAGSPHAGAGTELDSALNHVVPDRLLEHDPRDAMAELLGDPPPPMNTSRNE